MLASIFCNTGKYRSLMLVSWSLLRNDFWTDSVVTPRNTRIATPTIMMILRMGLLSWLAPACASARPSLAAGVLVCSVSVCTGCSVS
jgi:hypothetical protein